MQRREYIRTDGQKQSVGPVHFQARGVLIVNRTQRDAAFFDDAGNEYDAPALVAVTYPLNIPTSRFSGGLLAAVSAGDSGTLSVTLTDAETILSTAQLQTISLAGVAGTAKTATTIAALGAASDGEIARLRLGASPYDFVALIYDATYGRWVSEEIPLFPALGLWNSTDGVTSELRSVFAGAGTFNTANSFMRAKRFTDAGLRLESRIVGPMLGTQSNGFTTQVIVQAYEANQGDAATTFLGNVVAKDLGGIPVPNNTIYYFDTDWVRFNTAATKDLWNLNIALNSSVAQTIRFFGSVRARWTG